jgi:macrolide transport system ATP-binding/permease protein
MNNPCGQFLQFLSQFRRRLLSLLRRRKLQREMEEEMRFHLEMQFEQNLGTGMATEEAHFAARRQFGNQTWLKEASREMWSLHSIETLIQDLRYGLRIMLKNPGFMLIAVLTLALGIGANTAIFNIVNALLLRPIPGVVEAERLVNVGRTHEDAAFDSLSYPDYLDYREQNTVFSGIAIYSKTPLHLSNAESEGRAERVRGELVSGNYFGALGAKALLGRTLTPADVSAPGANPVAMMGYDLWRRRFGADKAIVGKTIKLNARPFTVIGVAVEGFEGTTVGGATEMWLPITMFAEEALSQDDNRNLLTKRGSQWIDGFARLKPAVTLQQAQAEMTGIAQRLALAYPNTNKKIGVRLTPHFGMWPDDRADAQQFTRLLLLAAGLTLFVASVNVANILFARSIERQKEIGVRLALGAARARIVRLLLMESLLMAMLSGLAGLFVARWASDFSMRFWTPKSSYGLQTSLELGFDASVLTFAFVVSFVTGIVFGLVPAWQAARTNIAPILKDGAPSGRTERRPRLRETLIVSQIALSLVVLVGAGLCVRTLHNALSINRGYNVDRVLTAEIDLGRQGYSEEGGRRFYQQLLERVQALPGVQSASLAHRSPLSSQMGGPVRPDGLDENAPSTEARYNIVTPRHLETIGLRLLRGRDFNAQDTAQAPGAAIINEALARSLWGEQDPIGRVLVAHTSRNEQRIEVIGVVNDARYGSVLRPPHMHLYFPITQKYQSSMALHVKMAGDAAIIGDRLQHEARTLDPNLPIYDVRTLSAQLDQVLASQRLAAALISSLGLLALLLTGIGLYGVMAYSVSQRRREIGIRMALGAQRSDVQKLVVRHGLTLALMGVALGLLLSFGFTRVLKSMLFGVSAIDPLTFAVIPILLAGVALLACWIPVRRALKVDPMVALRSE